MQVKYTISMLFTLPRASNPWGVNRDLYLDLCVANPILNSPYACTYILQELPGPEDQLYYPPLSIQMFDKRTFSRLSLVGTHVIKSINEFIVEDSDTGAQSDSPLQIGSSPSPMGEYLV
jgi:hypothetical protein